MVYEYATSEDGAYSTEVPVNAGTYYVRAKVEESDNYNSITGIAVQFVIAKKNITPQISASEDIVYDGTEKTATITFNGIVEGDELTAVLLYNGEASAVNAGTYEVTISSIGGADADNYQVETSITGSLTINKLSVTVSVSTDNKQVVYGSEYTLNASDFASAKVDGNGFEAKLNAQYTSDEYTTSITAGTTLEATLSVEISKDGVPVSEENYTVSGLENSTVTISVVQAEPVVNVKVTLTEDGSTKFTTEHTVADLTIANEGGTAGEIVWTTSGETQLTAGTNTLNWHFTPSDSTNYKEASGSVEISVAKAGLERIEVVTSEVKTYTAGDAFDKSVITVTAYYGDETSEEISDYTVSVNNVYMDTATITITYGGESATLTNGVDYNVVKREIAKPVVDTTTFEYDATAHNIDVVSTGGYDVDGTLSATNAGNYQITVTLTDTVNTKWADTQEGESEAYVIDWTITAKNVTLTIKGATKVYDGEEYDFSGYEVQGTEGFIASDNVVVTVSANSASANAGTYDLVITTTADDNDNYIISRTQDAKLVIEKTKVELPATPEALTYNGEEQTAGFATRDLYSVSGNTAKDAGTYEATFTLNDTTNYEWNSEEYKESASVNVEWTINKAKANLVAQEDVTTEYTGTIFDDYASLFAVTGVNEEVVELTYELNGGLAIKNAGVYTITARTKNDNYEQATASITYTVNAKNVTLTIEGAKKVYDGEEYDLSGYEVQGTEGFIASDNVVVTVSATNASANAGTYDLVITTTADDNKNYNITRSDNVKLVIEKAKATITAEAMSYVYGEEVASTGSAVVSGEVNGEKLEYSVAVDYAEEYVVGGDYNVVVTLTEESQINANYEITIENAKLTITKASVELGGELSISGWTYGEEANVPSGVTTNFGEVVYEYATSEDGAYSMQVPANAGTYYVRAKVEGTANYEGATSSAVEFVIERLQVVKPEAEEQQLTYTGSELTYVIPESEYYTISGNKATNAGNYTAKVTLKDTANTEWADGSQTQLSYEFSVAKLVIDKPQSKAQQLTYTGSELTYVIPESDYYTISGNKATNAGKYTAKVTLSDSTNVEWADGTQNELTYEYAIDKATRQIKANISVGYKNISIDITSGDKENALYSFDGINYYSVADDVAVELQSTYTIYLKYKATENYLASAELKVDAQITKSALKGYIDEYFAEGINLDNLASYDELAELVAVATGEDEEFDTAYAELTQQRDTLLQGIKADTEEALTAGGKLAGYAVQVAVAVTLTAIGAGVALATMAIKARKGGKKND